MSDLMNDLLAAMVTATPERKAAALRSLRGEIADVVHRADTEPFLTLREAARRLGVCPCSLWRWQVPGHELGGRRKFRISEIETYLASAAFKRVAADLRVADRERRAVRASSR